MARAVRINEYGGPEVLRVLDIPMPAEGDGQILLEIKAAGVNPVDSKIRRGTRAQGVPLTAPIGLGSDAGGIVVGIAPGVEGLAIGTEVIARGLTGAYATHVVATPDLVTIKPPSMSFEQASAIGVPFSTAYQVLKSIGLSAGETLLVHSGSGGVGQSAIQLAAHRGVRVIATAGAANQDRLRELGAEPVVYGDGLLERVRELTPDGVDAVLEAAGTQEALDVSLALVTDRARIGEIVNAAWAAEYGVTVYSGSTPGFMPPEALALRAESIAVAADMFAAGHLQLEIAQTYALEDVQEAHRHSDSGHVRGKIVLLP